MKKIILPSLTPEQVEYLIQEADTIRDKAIISLFADSGIRLTELLSIKEQHIDWDTNTVIIWGKSGKRRKALFTRRTAELLKKVLAGSNGHVNIWGLRKRGVQIMLYRLQERTGLPCNSSSETSFLYYIKSNDSGAANYECAGDTPDNERIFPGFVLQFACEQT